MKNSHNCIFFLSFAILLSLRADESAKATDDSDFGFGRSINPAWFPDDPRQWRRYDESRFITDLRKIRETRFLVDSKREKGRWKVLPYTTESVSGYALSCYALTEPPTVTLPLEHEGRYAVYVGLSTVSGGITKAQPSGIMARAGTQPTFRKIQNNMRLTSIRQDVVQEQFLTAGFLGKDEVMHIRALPNHAATVLYIRLVPLDADELIAWERQGSDPRYKTAVGTWDGHSWIWPYRPEVESDLSANFHAMDKTDFGQYWFGIMGADLVNYPSQHGTIAGRDTQDFPTRTHGEYVRSLVNLIDKGINPLLVARAEARKQQRQFHVFIRSQAWGASIPFEETFDSQFYKDHPEWRCVDEEGKRTMHMSWAVPEVQAHLLRVIREFVEMSDPDGVGFFFNRGMPLMLWEDAFVKRYEKKFGAAPNPADENKGVLDLRGEIMTEFLEELRNMLDEISATRNTRRYPITVTGLSREQYNRRFGLDIETWATRGLIDQVGVIVANHTSDGNEKYTKPDLSYYDRVLRNRGVPFYPFVVAHHTGLWANDDPADMCRLIMEWYREGATGIAVWDPIRMQSGYGGDVYQGQPIDVLAYLGHRHLIEYWEKNGVPLPKHELVTQLDDNEYSKWYPNVGY